MPPDIVKLLGKHEPDRHRHLASFDVYEVSISMLKYELDHEGTSDYKLTDATLAMMRERAAASLADLRETSFAIHGEDRAVRRKMISRPPEYSPSEMNNRTRRQARRRSPARDDARSPVVVIVGSIKGDTGPNPSLLVDGCFEVSAR